MTTVTDNDLKRVEDKIDRLADVVNNLAIIHAEFKGDIKGSIHALEENLNGQIKTLDQNLKGEVKTLTETIKGIDKRLDNIEILNRIVSGAVIGSVFVGLIKYLFFSNPNI